MTQIIPIILAGGSGSRLWPLSSPQRPKPLLSLGSGPSLLRMTINRLKNNAFFLPSMVIVTAEPLVPSIRDHLAGENVHILAEPEGKNTAAACITAALYALARYPCALMLVVPSDHLIAPQEGFEASLREALPHAQCGRLTVFGIAPDHPHTGYGYVLADADGCITRFHEKPDADAAQNLIAQGAWWNSGMFLWQPQALLEEAQTHCPDIVSACTAALEGATVIDTTLLLQARPWQSMRALPIDRAVLEKTTKAAMVRAQFDWSDMGTFESWYRILPRDAAGNASLGPVTMQDCRYCLIINTTPDMFTVGDARDMLIVHTPQDRMERPLKRV